MTAAAPTLRELDPASVTETRRRGYNSAPLYDFKPSGAMTLKIENIWQAGVQASRRDMSARRVEDLQ